LAKKKTQVVPKSLLGKAVNYALSQWARLLVYLDHGSMTPDNNRAENAIRPFVLGRKNWLFAGKGAQTVQAAKSVTAISVAPALLPSAKTRRSRIGD
jgi:transposase